MPDQDTYTPEAIDSIIEQLRQTPGIIVEGITRGGRAYDDIGTVTVTGSVEYLDDRNEKHIASGVIFHARVAKK